MEYNYAAEDKSQRIRAIIITIAFSVIVLGIAAWAIIAIVGSRNGGETAKVEEETPVAVIEETKVEETKVEEVKTEAKAEESKATEAVVKTTAPAKSTATVKPASKETVPETGPEELLPLAMILGMGTAFAFSRKMVKAEA